MPLLRKEDEIIVFIYVAVNIDFYYGWDLKSKYFVHIEIYFSQSSLIFFCFLNNIILKP